jgi:hypothetical protein
VCHSIEKHLPGRGILDLFQLLRQVEIGKRSTNPIWQLASVFGQLGSWNETTKRVVVDEDGDGAGKKSGGWSMNLKGADCKGGSSAKAGALR